MTEPEEYDIWALKVSNIIAKAVRAYSAAPNNPSSAAIAKYKQGLERYWTMKRAKEILRWTRLYSVQS